MRWLATNTFVDSCTSRCRRVIELTIHSSSISRQLLVIPSQDSLFFYFHAQCHISIDGAFFHLIREKSKLIHSLEYVRHYLPRRKKHEHDQVSCPVSWARDVPASPP